MIQKNENIFQNELDIIKAEMRKDSGFSRLSEEKQKMLIEKMEKVVLKRFFLEIFEKLSKMDRERMQGLIENESSPLEMENFLKSRIPGYEEMVKKIVENFIEEMKKEI